MSAMGKTEAEVLHRTRQQIAQGAAIHNTLNYGWIANTEVDAVV